MLQNNWPVPSKFSHLKTAELLCTAGDSRDMTSEFEGNVQSRPFFCSKEIMEQVAESEYGEQIGNSIVLAFISFLVIGFWFYKTIALF